MKHFLFAILCWLTLTHGSAQTAGSPSPRVVVGAERLERLLPLIRDKHVGLVVNQSSLVGNTHLVDTLCHLQQCVERIFAPEHGFRGAQEAGELVSDDQDLRTGIPIISLYGKKKKPAAEDLACLDLVVFDIQDVGTRFYTYISTLYYVLEACAEQGIPVIILDRPNPNGHYVDGPVLDMRYTSFVGIAPLPIVYGCTMGELARLFVGEYWVPQPRREFAITVIPCQNYRHTTPYDLPRPPSPNLPNSRSVLLYPSLCLLEGTAVSVGRGTDMPFQVFGHPELARDSFAFVPRPNAGSKHPPFEGWVCKGLDLRAIPIDSLRNKQHIDLEWLMHAYDEFPKKSDFFLSNNFFSLLAGNNTLRKQIEDGCTEQEIRESWEDDLKAFEAIRLKYLLYP